MIGAIGGLSKEKNQIQLVAAVERLRSAGVRARALLIGDGAERTKIEARARERGVPRDIAVTGFVHDVRPFVAACDVLAVCSLDDTVSVGALEAMALRKPVVHSDVGSGGETIHPGYNGFLFRANDTAALVKHLMCLTNPDDRRVIGDHARGIVERRFSEERMIESYESLLMKLTAELQRSPPQRLSACGPRRRHCGGPQRPPLTRQRIARVTTRVDTCGIGHRAAR